MQKIKYPKYSILYICGTKINLNSIFLITFIKILYKNSQSNNNIITIQINISFQS